MKQATFVLYNKSLDIVKPIFMNVHDIIDTRRARCQIRTMARATHYEPSHILLVTTIFVRALHDAFD